MYITARHMAVFLRYDLGVEDAGSDDQILTRLKQIGGERVPVEQWDSTGRDRDTRWCSCSTGCRITTRRRADEVMRPGVSQSVCPACTALYTHACAQ